jgi:hypothetical protein
MARLDVHAARAIAEDRLARESDGLDLVLLDRVDEIRRHWVFYPNSRAFAETADPLTALAGNGPYAVPMDGGPLKRLSPALPAESQLPERGDE